MAGFMKPLSRDLLIGIILALVVIYFLEVENPNGMLVVVVVCIVVVVFGLFSGSGIFCRILFVRLPIFEFKSYF